MVAFPKPTVVYKYNAADEIAALRRWRKKPDRRLPARTTANRLVATWNIANLGVQKRRPDDYRLIAEIISWFDLVAVQEVADNLDGLRGIMAHLPSGWAMRCSDKGGNDERAAFLFREDRVTPTELIGEVAVPANEHADIQVPDIKAKFNGFDRNPYLAAFKAGKFTFVLVNVHLFFGSDKAADVRRRALEAFAVARWADLRRKSKNAYSKNIICLGDFNLPSRNAAEPVYAALHARGMYLPEYGTTVPEHAGVPENNNSNINDDHPFDQMAVVPGMRNRLSRPRPFDYDGAVFSDLYAEHGQVVFRAYLRYYMSDHRPLWTELKVA